MESSENAQACIFVILKGKPLKRIHFIIIIRCSFQEFKWIFITFLTSRFNFTMTKVYYKTTVPRGLENPSGFKLL